MTAHELAQRLLAGPDLPVGIYQYDDCEEPFTEIEGTEKVVDVTESTNPTPYGIVLLTYKTG